MNSKVLLTPIVLVPILLTGCKGAIISSDRAKVVLNNIADNVSEGIEYNKFTFTYSEKSFESTQSMKVIYDKNSKFFYAYSILDYQIDEYWQYAKNNKDGVNCLYKAERHNGAVDENGFPIVSSEIKEFSDEDWNEVVESVENIVNSYLDYSIERIEKFINYKEVVSDKDVQLSSLNENSICAEATIGDMKAQYIIDNDKLSYFKSYSSDDSYTEFTCSYGKASIVYLNI